jgi:hypothetical protein
MAEGHATFDAAVIAGAYEVIDGGPADNVTLHWSTQADCE